MTETQVLITIVAGTPQQLTTVKGTMCAKVSAQAAAGTGPLVYIGGPLLNKGTKAGLSQELAVGASPSSMFNREDQGGCNTLDASTFYFDGDHSGDTILATYSQS